MGLDIANTTFARAVKLVQDFAAGSAIDRAETDVHFDELAAAVDVIYAISRFKAITGGGPTTANQFEPRVFDNGDGTYSLKERRGGAWVTLRTVDGSTGDLAGASGDLDDDLQAIANLESAADLFPYATGAQMWAMTALTSLARQLLGGATTGAMQTTLGLVPGTNVQAQNARLQDIATNLAAASGIVEKTGANAFGTFTVTAFLKSLAAAVDAAAARTVLEALGSTGDQTIVSTDAGADAGPLLKLYRDSASPAASDTLAATEWRGKTSLGEEVIYARDTAVITDPTSGAEFGQRLFQTMQNNVWATRARVGGGLFTEGVTGGDKGVGTMNVGVVYESNIRAASIGVFQTPQDFTGGSRVASTAYQNTTGRPIEVKIAASVTTSRFCEASPDGSTGWVKVGYLNNSASAPTTFIVPPSWWYRVNGSIDSLLMWTETRTPP